MSGPSVVVAATFTAEPIGKFIGHWLNAIHLKWPVVFAPFDQVFQTILDPTSLFAANTGGVNVVLLDRDLPGLDTALAAYRGIANLVVVNTPRVNGPGGGSVTPISPLIRNLDGSAIASAYAVDEIFDSHSAREGAIPYTEEFLAALATALAREIHLLVHPPHKVIAVDCDNTLWRGICGEDGPLGVEADPPRLELQQFLADQRDAGKLLAIVSKNNEDDIWEVFAAHPEFPLGREHFAAWRVNWDAKSENLKSLAAELNLGLDAFLFLDDDARECAEVRTDAPAVTVLPLPPPESLSGFLRHVWAFDQVPATAEDKLRSGFYQAESVRAQAESSSASFAEFLAGLELKVAFEPVSAANLPRAAQLTQRTNQMNCSTIRRTEGALSAVLEQGELTGWVVSVADRFGDYGIVGLLLVASGVVEWEAETLLLSCRAMGRGVEHRMLAFVSDQALAAGVERVRVRFESTRKNKPAQAFLESLPAARVDGGFVIAASTAARISYVPAAATPKPAARAIAELRNGSPDKPDYATIAVERSPRELVARLRARGSMSRDMANADAVEQDLALLWSELLGGVPVGREADFFGLGGHSLLAVQLLSRVRKDFGVELTLDVVYSGPMTVRRMAQAIRSQSGAMPAMPEDAEIAAMLAEIENLSDEEVQAALAAEGELRSP